ncbi:LysR family transcriptional regulator [Nitratireductor indicus C115]|uniref:LysR family transcriptional regulator n=1 Tax=Nitratireductor indicus C115 TaxID=1231190 RepID=K2N844_9HYPH|nr:LysR substrate-binding domain-containing protein [Nitratireductor indicus]EKF43608.1 LysR family transcriptional regulator [Nitratireductor indicus C115]SFQ03518.1 DNA-binding transcriptional regulator, LysR family [Nitratireductor indicus]
MKNLHRTHLNGLRALEAVGRLGSLRAAAAELGVSVGAVSQQIIKTEAQLGSAIFERSGRGVVPTPLGRRFLDRLTIGFQTLDTAVAMALHNDDSVLTISVAPVFASKWLVPRLAAYARAHPETKLRLEAAIDLVNPDSSDIDLAIRVGEGGWRNVRSEMLLPQEIFPVCAPALTDRLKAPRDILKAPVIRDINSNIDWNVWLKPLGLDEQELAEGDTFTDAALCLDAAIAGQGVMLAWHTLAHDALRAGRLVAPFPQRATTRFSYWLVTSANRPEPAKVRVFKAWIRAEIDAMLAESSQFQGRESP